MTCDRCHVRITSSSNPDQPLSTRCLQHLRAGGAWELGAPTPAERRVIIDLELLPFRAIVLFGEVPRYPIDDDFHGAASDVFHQEDEPAARCPLEARGGALAHHQPGRAPRRRGAGHHRRQDGGAPLEARGAARRRLTRMLLEAMPRRSMAAMSNLLDKILNALRRCGLHPFGFAQEDFRGHHQLLAVWGPALPFHFEVWRWPTNTGTDEKDRALRPLPSGSLAMYERIGICAERVYAGRSFQDAKRAMGGRYPDGTTDLSRAPVMPFRMPATAAS